MSQTAHTPGPWEIISQNGDPEESFRGIAAPYQTNSHGKQYRTYVAQYCLPENAPIIAAAPELFEVLKGAQLFLAGLGHNLPQIGAAIAKAEGRQP